MQFIIIIIIVFMLCQFNNLQILNYIYITYQTIIAGYMQQLSAAIMAAPIQNKHDTCTFQIQLHKTNIHTHIKINNNIVLSQKNWEMCYKSNMQTSMFLDSPRRTY